MRLLIDTNIFLEVLLEQKEAAAASELLTNSDKHELLISDFALHSVCLLVLRHKSVALLESFLEDSILAGNLAQIFIPAAELNDVLDNVQLLKLDFDDAYQYTMAEKNGLTLVSFDKDFDRTPRGRQTPQAINQLTS